MTCKTGQMSVRPSIRPFGVNVFKTRRRRDVSRIFCVSERKLLGNRILNFGFCTAPEMTHPDRGAYFIFRMVFRNFSSFTQCCYSDYYIDDVFHRTHLSRQCQYDIDIGSERVQREQGAHRHLTRLQQTDLRHESFQLVPWRGRQHKSWNLSYHQTLLLEYSLNDTITHTHVSLLLYDRKNGKNLMLVNFLSDARCYDFHQYAGYFSDILLCRAPRRRRASLNCGRFILRVDVAGLKRGISFCIVPLRLWHGFRRVIYLLKDCAPFSALSPFRPTATISAYNQVHLEVLVLSIRSAENIQWRQQDFEPGTRRACSRKEAEITELSA